MRMNIQCEYERFRVADAHRGLSEKKRANSHAPNRPSLNWSSSRILRFQRYIISVYTAVRVNLRAIYAGYLVLKRERGWKFLA